jgi:hypothetical protein
LAFMLSTPIPVIRSAQQTARAGEILLRKSYGSLAIDSGRQPLNPSTESYRQTVGDVAPAKGWSPRGGSIRGRGHARGLPHAPQRPEAHRIRNRFDGAKTRRSRLGHSGQAAYGYWGLEIGAGNTYSGMACIQLFWSYLSAFSQLGTRSPPLRFSTLSHPHRFLFSSG